MDNKILVKFNSKSNRVKGLSFHPTRPWILASLHNGVVQLWDYRMGTLLDKFEEHEGPVRGVDFHKSQPLFTSGGDDYKVKVWNYKLRRCLYTLLGHLDYIRTVQFHTQNPWIVSASDDQTIRIWNWQARSCLSVLTGHNHYVMCASFHPKDELVVSASLDQTVRVWDTSGLKKKSSSRFSDSSVAGRVNNDLFGGNDAVVKYILEGHERGVNWASFHPTLPLVCSGADDRQVKLWRINETKAWEVDALRGHTNNVSCAIFHPKQELIISNSEDRCLRVWDIAKRLSVLVHRRESDRFWIVAAHPTQNLLAAGHDNGMTVFKLERERPALDSTGNKCYYVKDKYLRMLEYSSGKDTQLISLRRTTSVSTTPGLGGNPHNLSFNYFNKQEQNILIVYDCDGGYYELITLPVGASEIPSSSDGASQDIKRGSLSITAVFVSRDKFVVLEKSRNLVVKNLQNTTLKKITVPTATVDNLFFGGVAGRVILKCEDKVILFDYEARKVIGEIMIHNCKYVVWNDDFTNVACFSKGSLVLANRNFDQLASTTESVRIKGGCWDSSKPIFIYNTTTHVKYIITNNDHGVLRFVDSVIYPMRLVSASSMQCMDREGKVRNIEVDVSEAMFKYALEKKDYHKVMQLVKDVRLCGQSMISFLQSKGYPEIALHFAQNAKSKFKLALACGNIQVAMEVANEIGDDAWRQLGVEALRQGNFEVVEMSYQKTKEFERLSFLYLITGNTEKLKKMLKIAEIRNDTMSRFHNSLYLGDAQERMKVLESTGQFSLAYLTAVTHGLTEEAERLHQILVQSNIPVPNANANAELLQPPTPIIRSDNWPLLTVTKPLLSDILNGNSVDDTTSASKLHAMADDDDDFHDTGMGDWGDDDDMFDDEEAPKKEVKKEKKSEAKGWGEDDLDLSDEDLDLGDEDNDTKDVQSTESYPALTHYWCRDSSLAADHVAAGSIETSLNLLNRQIALSNAAPLKASARAVLLGSSGFISGFPLLPAYRTYLVRAETTVAGKNEKPKALPNIALSVNSLLETLKSSYKAFTAGQFAETQSLLNSILGAVPFVVTSNRSEANDLKELVSVCREYITAIRVKDAMSALTGKEDRDSTIRTLELGAYFTHCALQPAHLLLALKTAMVAAFKSKNYINAASFARRLLELPDIQLEKNEATKTTAQKALQKSEKEGRNEFTINYDEKNPFVLDCAALSPIYKGSAVVKCPYCGSCYGPSEKNKLCVTCNISTIGVDTMGLTSSSARGKA